MRLIPDKTYHQDVAAAFKRGMQAGRTEENWMIQDWLATQVPGHQAVEPLFEFLLRGIRNGEHRKEERECSE